MSAREWQQAKRGTLASFTQLVTDMLKERAEKAEKEDEDTVKLEPLARRVRALL